MSLKLEAHFAPSVVLLANALEVCAAPVAPHIDTFEALKTQVGVLAHVATRIHADSLTAEQNRSMLDKAYELIAMRKEERVAKIRLRKARLEEAAVFKVALGIAA